MSREKQIEEMAKTLCFQANSCDVKSCVQVNCEKTWLAEALYNAGYRKSTELAEEIFAEIEKTFKECLWFLENHPSNYPTMDKTKIKVYKDNLQYIAELKKKYTEVAERRKGVENSPVDCSTPNVTDQKGEGK